MTPTLVVGIDGSTGSAEALRWAIDEARRRDQTVAAIYAWTNRYGGDCIVPPLVSMEQAHAVEASILEHAVDEVVDGVTDVVVTRQAIPGSPAATLIDAAKDAQMLVVGTRGRGGFAGLLLGSVSHQVLAHAPCPVCVVPGGPSTRPAVQRVVVGIDGSPGADAALDWAIAEARLRHAELDVFHVWSFPMTAYVPGTASAQITIGGMEGGAYDILDVALAARDLDGLAVHRRVREGSVADVLTKAADDADLLVVGARGRGGFAGLLLGSASYECASHSPCPVVVVPAPSTSAA
jgi:nucleotide-binding universal stress UspA family protein